MIEVALAGRLGQPPERRSGNGGKRWAVFSLAVDQGEAGPEWVQVTVFEPLLSSLPAELEKGERLYVEGRLRLNRYECSGSPRASLQVAATVVTVLGRIGQRRKTNKPAAGDAKQGRDKTKAAYDAAVAAGCERRLPDDPVPF